MTFWVITKLVNDYNQYGQYFISAYTEKPTAEQIKKTLKCSDELAVDIEKGGGRASFEDIWFELHEIKSGELFTEN